MPLKWKIYYWCSIYYFLWTAGILALLIYIMVSDRDQSYGQYSVLLIPVAMLAKPLLSIKLIVYYKNKDLFKNRELITFVALFIINIIYTVIIAGMYFALTANSSAAANFSSKNITITLSTPLFIVASIYLMILDMPLKSIIRKQHHSDIVVIGQDINEHI